MTVPAARLERLATLAIERRVRVTIGVDSLKGAQALARMVRPDDRYGLCALIEVDSGEHRSGVQPQEAERLAEIAEPLSENGLLRGVFTHAGHSYSVCGREALIQVADAERSAVVAAAETLRSAGYSIDVVSAGSTPTVCYTESADGLTEYRAGGLRVR